MPSNFMKKLLLETLEFSRCWMMLNQLNNESIIINIIAAYIFNSIIEVYPPTNVKNTSFKILANFQIKFLHYNEGRGIGSLGVETINIMLYFFRLYAYNQFSRLFFFNSFYKDCILNVWCKTSIIILKKKYGFFVKIQKVIKFNNIFLVQQTNIV